MKDDTGALLDRAHFSLGGNMNDAAITQLILTYVEGWKSGDREKILSTLDSACVVIESYGPTYRGKEMVDRWIDAWFAPGNVVNRWDVTALYATDEACFFEWIFECTYAGDRSGFEGVSIARLSKGKIAVLREYAMTAPRYEWKG
jgi:hypothetical protein